MKREERERENRRTGGGKGRGTKITSRDCVTLELYLAQVIIIFYSKLACLPPHDRDYE